jgi:hypothetical protein
VFRDVVSDLPRSFDGSVCITKIAGCSENGTATTPETEFFGAEPVVSPGDKTAMPED